MKKEIKTANAPGIGPYSQGIETENLIFFLGRSLDPKSMQLVEGQENQIRQVFKNIDALCKEAGLSLNHVVKLNVSLQTLPSFNQ